MKKLLGISLVAVLAVTPLMARADTNPSAYALSEYDEATNANGEAGLEKNSTTTPVAAAGKYFKGKTVSDADATKVATGAYVKGAYNAAISAVNALGEELSTAIDGITLTEGEGIDINTELDGSKTINVSLTQNKGLQIDGTSHTLEIKEGDGIKTGANGVEVDLTSNDGLEIDSNHKLGIKDGDGIKTGANGVEVDLKTIGGLEIDDHQLKAKVDGTTISIDSSTGALKANLGDYATKTGVIGTVESAYVNAVTDAELTSSGVEALTTWGNDNATTTMGAAQLVVTKQNVNVQLATTGAGTEQDPTVKYRETAIDVGGNGVNEAVSAQTKTTPAAANQTATWVTPGA